MPSMLCTYGLGVKGFYCYRIWGILPSPSFPTSAPSPSCIVVTVPTSNTAGLQFHPLPLGGGRGLHAETVSGLKPTRRRPSRRDATSRGRWRPVLRGRSGSHGAWVLADAVPRTLGACCLLCRESPARSSRCCSPPRGLGRGGGGGWAGGWSRKE